MSSVEFEFEMGDKLRDRVTGLEGICDSRRELLNGCIQYSLQSRFQEKESKMGESWWIDGQQLERIDHGINDKPVKKSTSGGPMTRSN